MADLASRFEVLSPEEFRAKKNNERNNELNVAFNEFLCNCRALTMKANTALMAQADAIRGGLLVDLERNYIGAAGLQAMSTLLSKNDQLLEIRLPHNGISNDAVVFFCRSMRCHPAIQIIDFSQNMNISLAGGLAILSLIQQNPHITQVKLHDTQVPLPVMEKIERALEHNRQHKPIKPAVPAEPSVQQSKSKMKCGSAKDSTTAAADVPAVSIADAQSNEDATAADGLHESPRQSRDKLRHQKWMEREAELLDSLRVRVQHELRNDEKKYIPPTDSLTGWTVVEVAILAPPCIFDSEVEELIQQVFPKLNDELFPRHVVVIPVINGAQAPPGSYLRALHFSTSCDLLANVVRSRFVTIELLGDRPGEFEQLPANKMLMSEQYASVHARDAPVERMEEGTQERVIRALEAKTREEGPMMDPPLHPVLYAAHDAALQHSRFLILATRRDTKQIGIPPSLAPLFSSEPPMEHPDKHQLLVRKLKTGTTLCNPNAENIVSQTTLSTDSRMGITIKSTITATLKPQANARILSDREVEEKKWQDHVAFRERAIASLPTPELLIENYGARFDRTSDNGQLRLTGLEEFSHAVYERLRLLFTTLFPIARTSVSDDFAGSKAHHRYLEERTAQQFADHHTIRTLAELSIQKKSLTNRLNLYVVTPPSRNSLVLHSTEQLSLTSLLCCSASRLMTMPYAYTVAAHSARSILLREEPTDLRDVMVHIISQLTSSPQVLRYLHREVDIQRLKAYFVSFLSGSKPSIASTFPDDAPEPPFVPKFTCADVTGASVEGGKGGGESPNTILVVYIDGLDSIEASVEPCLALRQSVETGADVWDEALVEAGDPLPSSGGSKAPAKAAGSITQSARSRPTSAQHFRNELEFIPMCLARNARLIGTCVSNSERIRALDERGRDSTEVFGIGTSSANDVEQMLSQAALAHFGVELSDDEFSMAREKTDARNPEYIRYLVDALRRLNEAPGYCSQTEMVRSFPATVNEAARRVYREVVDVFGIPFTQRAMGLLLTARWGLSTPELRSLLKLEPKRFNEFLRLLRPVIEQPFHASRGQASGNLLLGRVHIVAPSFLGVLVDEEIQRDSGADEDKKVWHGVLAHHYLAVVKQSISAESSSPTQFALDAHGPYERQAVKELCYHLSHAGMWSYLDHTILSATFMMLVYRNGLGYHYVRDLIDAFNIRYEGYLMGEDIGATVPALSRGSVVEDNSLTGSGAANSPSASSVQSPAHRLPIVLTRHRDYVYFARRYSAKLLEFPHLVVQTAVEQPDGSGFVKNDCHEYLRKVFFHPTSTAPSKTTFFSMISTKKGRAHLGAVTTSKFSNTGKILVSGSADRSLNWTDPVSGYVNFQIRQATARVQNIHFCATSAYLGVVAEDRSMYVYDGHTGNLLSRNYGDAFTSPISTFTFSARGRYYMVATRDVAVRVFDSEKGTLLFTMQPEDLITSEAERKATHLKRSNTVVLPDPCDDEIFSTFVNDALCRWRVVEMRDGFAATEVPPCRLHAQVTRGEWCWKPAQPEESDEEVAARKSEVAMLQHVGLDHVSLYAMKKGTEVMRCVVPPVAPITFAPDYHEEAAPAFNEAHDTTFTSPREGPPPPVITYATFSGDHTSIAAATEDGRVCLFSVDWMTVMNNVNGGDVYAPAPTHVFEAFANATVQRIIGLAFRGTSPGLFCLGNQRQLKYWDLRGATASADTTYVQQCDGEFTLPREATAWAVNPTVAADECAEVAIGDVTGQMTLLTLWKPSS